MSERKHLLDFLRGLALVNMVLYHLCYDLVYLFDFSLPWLEETAGFVWQQATLMLFILIAGYASKLSRHPLRGGLKLLLWGLLISLVTFYYLPQEFILFGVLSFLGCAYVLTACLQGTLAKIPWRWGLLACLLCFVLTKQLASGALGLYPWVWVEVPVSSEHPLLLFVLGLPQLQLSSADYVPLFPWLFLFGAGHFLGQGWSLPQVVGARNPLAFLGRHSLVAYLVHQPLLYGVLVLLLKKPHT